MRHDEQQLVARCIRQDRQAQRQLYDTYKVPLFRVCLRYAACRDDAEDMLQEGFVRIFQDLPAFRGDGPLGAWLRRVMVNTALQHLRRQKKLLPTADMDTLPDVPDDDGPWHLMGEGQPLDAEALTAKIQQLPPGYRTVFNLYVMEGMPHKEIADQLGISVSTSKSQLHKAKALLRAWIEAQMRDSISDLGSRISERS